MRSDVDVIPLLPSVAGQIHNLLGDKSKPIPITTYWSASGNGPGGEQGGWPCSVACHADASAGKFT